LILLLGFGGLKAQGETKQKLKEGFLLKISFDTIYFGFCVTLKQITVDT